MGSGIWLALIVGFLFPTGPAGAQVTDISFLHYTTDQGLSNDEVKCILKDRRGFMWFGTVNGLNRFDGQRFKVYRRAGKQKDLPGNYIIGLTLDPDGIIWVATNLGLCRLDPDREAFRQIVIPPNRDQIGDNDVVYPLILDKEGYGWFSGVDQLYRIDRKTLQLTVYPLPQNAHSQSVRLYIDRRNTFWVFTEGVIYRFDPARRQYTYVLGRDSRHPQSDLQAINLFEDSRQQLWLFTLGRGLLRYEPAHDRFTDVPDKLTNIHSLCEDRTPDGRPFFWGGGGETGLFSLDPVTLQYTVVRPEPRDPLSHNGSPVAVFYRDEQTGVIWMGTEWGIEKLDPYALKVKRKWLPIPAQGGRTERVRFVSQDRLNPDLYWIGTRQEGLWKWNRRLDTFTRIMDKRGLLKQGFFRMVQDKRGIIWLSMPYNLVQYDPQHNTWLYKDDWAPKAEQKNLNDVFDLAIDRTGQIWFSSAGQVYSVNPATGQLRPRPLPESVNNENAPRIYEFCDDSQGRMWVYTVAGLFRYEAQRTEAVRIPLRLADTSLRFSDRIFITFSVDSRDRLWIGNIGFLAQADTTGRVTKTYNSDNGLMADHVLAMKEDKAGQLWLATDTYLHRLNPETGEFQYFQKDNGLFSNFIISNSVNTMSRNAQGELFIGFINAFNYFDPLRLARNTVPPPVAVTSVLVNNQPRTLDDSRLIALHPGDNSLSVEFAALNYSQPEKNQYAYQLVGFDKGWVNTSARTATYTNLEPGNYTLRIKAANNDGVWNQEGLELGVRVIPAYYQTWWFQLLCVLVVTAAGYAVYRNREAQRQKLEGIRNRIATDLHDDMGSTLSSIRIFSDVVQQQIQPVRPEAVPILQRISTSATTLSESMQDIIWTIQTKYDSLEDVVTRMREFGLKMAEARDIRFMMDVSDKFHSTRLNVEQRRNLYLIFKESLNNAVKYADCTTINVFLTVVGKHLKLVIEDNGRGFDPKTVRQGNGLQNLQKRANEIKGQLTLQAAPGAGTRIELLTRV
ncbi:hypothetical protein GCM10023187_24530 [Nibrella viscosa]|uniref:Histidine kinase domain-containing protein n=2 Tax=Nibrella viscosa TaxID=1084524 RepID=A0ABP8KFU6_9BACT